MHEVDVTTLDAFIIEYNIEHVDLLKIDTEGFEFSVMSGCLESIKNNKIKLRGICAGARVTGVL